jgi:hypothetical protein
MPARPQKRAKTEVQREFEEVREEVRSAADEANSKIDAAAKLRDAETRQAVEDVSVESVVKRISILGLDISRALANVSQQLTDEVEKLVVVRQAVELEGRELARLHKIDIAATALDQLVQDYDRRKLELEQEVSARRSAWEEEARTVERERKEQEEALRKQRQREAEDYEYKKGLERKKAQDKYEEEQRLLERKNQEKQESLEKSWQQRSAALKESEEELTRLRKESDQFPDRLQRETQRAADEAARTAEARVRQEMLIMQKEADADKRVAELRIKTLEDMIAQQSSQLSALQKQLDDAKAQVQEIAVKAIEGASGAKALSHINQIAIEQARQRSPQS